MSGRFNDYKGSSRSSRDDSRTHRARDERERRKSRSRSPRKSPKRSKEYSERSTTNREKERRDYEERKNKRSLHLEATDEEVPPPPPPPRITKISIGFTKPNAPIKMNLGGSAKVTPTPKPTVASVFNDDDDEEEPEEMPAEAKMRMRNIGRETPTSAGPNSFGKTKQGFCDAKKVFEKNMKQALELADNKVKPSQMTKFPQTIYKINGP